MGFFALWSKKNVTPISPLLFKRKYYRSKSRRAMVLLFRFHLASFPESKFETKQGEQKQGEQKRIHPTILALAVV